MIPRNAVTARIKAALRRNPIVALLGPRQCGKTTLAQQFLSSKELNYFDLEDTDDLARLGQPMTALRGLRGLVVIDEVQRRPDLFPVLRVLADRKPLPARFLILGSTGPALLRQSSESLAGRLETIRLSGFSLQEVGASSLDRLWLRGGFPRSFLARAEIASLTWRKEFIQTFLERDLPQMGINIPAPALLRFWTMLAHYHGQIWNAAEHARVMGVSEPTARRYLDALEGMLMVRQLYPWFQNLGKRQVKSPKVYLRDAGLLHYLLGIHSQRDLLVHPKSGASWEGFVIEEIMKAIEPDQVYFWATHNGAELDVLLLKNGKRIGVECKRVDIPRVTPSMKIALADLKLDRLAVIYPGMKRFKMDDRIEAVPLTALAEATFAI